MPTGNEINESTLHDIVRDFPLPTQEEYFAMAKERDRLREALRYIGVAPWPIDRDRWDVTVNELRRVAIRALGGEW